MLDENANTLETDRHNAPLNARIMFKPEKVKTRRR
jgi:hypothetical protein